jgi:iron(III) transport system substrate-binding protein
LAFGLTDTDDALVMIRQAHPVTMVYPDRGADEMGTLFIPNTLAIVKDCPHPQAARRLVDYLLRPETEKRLAQGPSGQIPLNPDVEVKLQVETPRTVKAMPVDFPEAVKQWDAAAAFVREHFFTAN